MSASASTAAAPVAEEVCGGCYTAVGGELACYRWHWREACACERCLERAALAVPGQKVEPCSSCGAPIYWARGARGGKVPVSVKTGQSHFRDCPHAAEHSKRRVL